MTPEQKRLIRASFELVLPIAEDFTDIFYGRLFKLKPSLRPLFSTSTEEQGRKLMQTLSAVVLSLDFPDGTHPALEGLGRRHRGYGVQDEDYALLWQALLWTFNATLQDRFSAETAAAWKLVFDWMSGIMRGQH